MIQRGQAQSEEITYAEVAYKLESGVRDQQNACTFRYCKESKKCCGNLDFFWNSIIQ